VLGKRYFVMERPRVISAWCRIWYGPGFHAAATSNGERYDMYAMTAAPNLPCRRMCRSQTFATAAASSCVNDRGPFKDGGIIDVSYTAASRLDMLKDGTTFVEVRALTPEQKRRPHRRRQRKCCTSGWRLRQANAS
jgi:rare lipoprotein A